MLTAMKRGFDLLAEHKGITMNLASIPPEDPRTYAMIRAADTLGAFQIESRAQMAMLPHIKPRTFYDLVIDRKSVVSGKSGSVRVEFGGRRIIKKKTKQKIYNRGK